METPVEIERVPIYFLYLGSETSGNRWKVYGESKVPKCLSSNVYKIYEIPLNESEKVKLFYPYQNEFNRQKRIPTEENHDTLFPTIDDILNSKTSPKKFLKRLDKMMV